jgi:hypothetical protein
MPCWGWPLVNGSGLAAGGATTLLTLGAGALGIKARTPGFRSKVRKYRRFAEALFFICFLVAEVTLIMNYSVGLEVDEIFDIVNGMFIIAFIAGVIFLIGGRE